MANRTAVPMAGKTITPRHTAVNVATDSTVVIAANPSRKWLLLVNDADTPIWVKLGAAAKVHEGIRINANGGSLELSSVHDCLYLGAVNGMHASANNKVMLVTEGV